MSFSALVTRQTAAGKFASAIETVEDDCDVLVMAAAVADFAPAQRSEHKIKKTGDDAVTLTLVPTEDLLRGLVDRGKVPVVVGFAAETGDDAATAAEHAAAKARRKGAALLVFNEVGATKGFGDVPNSVRILDAQGHEVASASGSKLAVAHAVLDEVARLWTPRGQV